MIYHFIRLNMVHRSLSLKCVKLIRLKSVQSLETSMVWLILSSAGVTEHRINYSRKIVVELTQFATMIFTILQRIRVR